MTQTRLPLRPVRALTRTTSSFSHLEMRRAAYWLAAAILHLHGEGPRWLVSWAGCVRLAGGGR